MCEISAILGRVGPIGAYRPFPQMSLPQRQVNNVLNRHNNRLNARVNVLAQALYAPVLVRGPICPRSFLLQVAPPITCYSHMANLYEYYENMNLIVRNGFLEFDESEEAPKLRRSHSDSSLYSGSTTTL